ncbi:AAA family ATPase [Rhodococcus pyridinivorans]|uniref:AAA family ATPase n=1 Tax=Rhodococcus pyridinivorans TaxID=103816 RepID=UPI0021641F4A|nr:AAA family ATPase [Rhodococcus pyridinivorans]UVT25004.1 AAA family ATPase [Rhodococcus pyridinivorans]
MDRVLFVDVETAHTDAGTLVLPLDNLALERIIAKEQVAFVVLDAATSSMASELSGRDDRAVRQYLEPLAQLAARQGCVVFGLCHFGKRDGADTGKLILGSIAWSQVARSVLSIAQDSESGRLVVTNTKANLAPRVRSMEGEVVSTTVATEDGDTEVGVLRWLGETSRDARELLTGPDEGAEERDEITTVIRGYLIECGGSAPAADVLKVTRAAGLVDNAVKKARKRAGVRTERRGYGKSGSWVWTIDTGIGANDSGETT